MYSFSDFETVKELPDVVGVRQLAESIGMSVSRTYELIDERKIPYMKIGKRIFTDVAELRAVKPLPKVFAPSRLIDALGISNGNAYVLVRTPGFPAVLERNRIIVSKAGFIEWVRKEERNKI